MNVWNSVDMNNRYEQQNHLKEHHLKRNYMDLNSPKKEHNNIEKLFRECEKDLLDDNINYEKCSESKTEEW